MKQLKSLEEKKKKQKRIQIIFGIILVGLMILSTAGYAFTNFKSKEELEKNEKIIYNGKEFIKYPQAWVLEENPRIVLANSPKEVPQELFFVNTFEHYEDVPLYLEEKSGIPDYLIYENFRNTALRIQKACFKEPCSGDFPIKNCTNNFIILEINETLQEIRQEQGCVFIKGPQENMSKIIDSFVLEVFKIK